MKITLMIITAVVALSASFFATRSASTDKVPQQASVVAAVVQEDDNINAITKALQTGDVNTLQTYFDSTVEINMGAEEGIYTKAEAVGILRKFFAANKPSAYTQGHNGASKGGNAQYHIGTLSTSTGTFKVYIYLKTVGSQTLIQELRFDK